MLALRVAVFDLLPNASLSASLRTAPLFALDSVVVTPHLGASTREAQVDSLYLSFLSRHPRPDESAKAVKAMDAGLKPADLAWVLANTREFLFLP